VCGKFDFDRAATRVGMRMTIDGTGDDEIKIQGVPSYSFCEADAERAVGGGMSQPLTQGQDEEETAQLRGLVPETAADSSDEEGAHADSSDEDGDSSSEEEDDTALVYTSVARAPDEPPAGYRYVDVCPALGTEEAQLALVGRQKIYHAFDMRNTTGWFQGRISARGVSQRDLIKTPTANFVVAYDRRVTKVPTLHGRVASSLLQEKYGASEWWILLEPVE
jgi:hypothetical protein